MSLPKTQLGKHSLRKYFFWPELQLLELGKIVLSDLAHTWRTSQLSCPL